MYTCKLSGWWNFLPVYIIIQAELLMSNFQEAKSSLKKVIRLFQENSRLGEAEAEERKLSTGIRLKQNHHYCTLQYLMCTLFYIVYAFV